MPVAQNALPFHIELTENELQLTARAGLPVLIETLRAVVTKAQWRQLARGLGIKSWKVVRRHVEAIVLLIAAGGEHVSHVELLRKDNGLVTLLQNKPSSATQLKDFLYRFHQGEDGSKLTADDDADLSVRGKAQIRPDGPALAALERLVLGVVHAVQVTAPTRTATLDVDATIIEAHKALALRAYEGTRGYQPQMAWWAEQQVWICDEFRDGNVPAAYQVRAFIERAFLHLPEGIERQRLRGDSALYDEAGLSWADDAGIEFAVSAVMSPELTRQAQAIPDAGWRAYPNHDPRASGDDERQWAEIHNFVPDWKRNNRPGARPFRYIAIRVRSRQRDMFDEDEARWRHFAVVTNMDWRGDRLLNWQREKQGTVEHAHGTMKNDLAGGVMPSGRFGANAAWWRLNALVLNLLQLLEIAALPKSLARAKPKTLRFVLLTMPGRVIHHARTWTLKLFRGLPYAEALVAARRRIASLAAQLLALREAPA